MEIILLDEEKIAYLEENHTYDNDTLLYLLSVMSDHALQTFRKIAETKESYGLYTSALSDFKENRRAYDLSLTTLKAQGFIHQTKLGQLRPYHLTKRGEQLYELIQTLKTTEK